MPASNFDQLFEEVALKLFQDYQNSIDLPNFLQKKLPLRYGLDKGILVNRKKEIAPAHLIFYDKLNCPKLTAEHREPTNIIPANYAYGALSFLPEINQESLEDTLQKNAVSDKIYEGQKTTPISDKRPLKIWIANELAPFLSLNDLEDRLLAETYPPDLVAVLNSGLLVTLNDQTIQNIFALSEKENAQSFDKVIAADLMSITQMTMQKKYFKIGASAAYKNFFYSYVLLLDLLKNQTLLDGGLSAEMVAIW